jgi:hypothetical protein
MPHWKKEHGVNPHQAPQSKGRVSSQPERVVWRVQVWLCLVVNMVWARKPSAWW